MSETEKLKAIIYLLELENECLRSVLSEFEGDKLEYVEMNRAYNFRAALESLSAKDKK